MSDNGKWYIQHKGKAIGPVSSKKLKELGSQGKVKPDTLVRLGSSGEWVPASKVQGLFGLATTAKKQKTASVPAPIKSPQATMPATIEPQPITAVATPIATFPTPPAAPETKPCPFCGEQIALAAVKCRHCNEFLDGRQQSGTHPAPQPATVVNVNQVNNGGNHPRWNPGIAAVLSFLIPGLGQLYKGQPMNGLVWFGVVVIGYLAFVIPGLVLHVLCIAGAAMGNPYK